MSLLKLNSARAWRGVVTCSIVRLARLIPIVCTCSQEPVAFRNDQLAALTDTCPLLQLDLSRLISLR